MNKGNCRIFWRFVIDPAQRRAFLAAYAADGEWSRFFHEHKGHVATELFHSASEPDTYLTVDRWRSRADYEAFRQENSARYRELDERLERFTVDESFLGVAEDDPA